MSAEWKAVKKLVREFPGTEEAAAHGRQGFRVGKKFLCAFNEQENALGLRISMEERELLMEQAPRIYYVTDHYRPFPTVLVSLKHVTAEELRHQLERRWREAAAARLVKAYDEGRAAAGETAKQSAVKRTVKRPAQKQKARR
jgi:hypothetical protein